mgnify:CR=1 FL=1
MNNYEAARPERRRAVRHSLDNDALAGIRSSHSVRIIDISVGGVLLASTRPATVGARGRLSVALAGNPLATEVEIRRVVESSDHTNFRIGAEFVGISADQRDIIERLVRT